MEPHAARDQDFDVVIVGHGQAGALLARHLRLALGTSARLLVLEAAPELADYKVGESTVEVAANYMVRRLGLGTYLYQHQLPKNGVRFFFDSQERDVPLPEMSEMGTDRLPFHPAFQLERASFERDLLAMNLASGVDVRLGAEVVDLALGSGDADHRVTFVRDGARTTVSTRFVVDAGGRRQWLLKRLGVGLHRETRLNTASSWARYRRVPGVDSFGDAAWRERVCHTSRHLSTNHMMYDGYWIWFIPLAGDLMSVGVVYDKDRVPERLGTREAFEAFLGRHRATRELLYGAELCDFQQYAHLPYRSDQYFSADRWATTGFASAFVDPFYSPGADFIAIANDFIVELVTRALRGDRGALVERADLFNAYYEFWYERTLRIYAGLYPTFGSFEVFRLKYMLDFNNYYNLVVWPFMADKHLDVAWLRDELRFVDRVIQAQDSMAAQFVALAEKLRARGEYHAENRGRWHNVLAAIVRLQERLGPRLDEPLRRAQVQAAYSSVFAAVIERAAGLGGLSNRKAFLAELTFPTVVLFKDITEASVARLLDRAAARMKRDLSRELPDAQIAAIRLSAGGAEVESDAGHAEALAQRAAALWDARGESLAHVEL